jgi:hypothetical protein
VSQDDPHPVQLPALGDLVVTFTQTSPVQWLGVASCVHGRTESPTQLLTAGSLNPSQMVASAYRQHDLLVPCDCIRTPAVLNATVAYVPTVGVAPGEQRIILEQSATIEPPQTNFNFYGRLTCRRFGSYYIDANIKLGGSVRTGSRGVGQVFVAGTPPMLSAAMVDIANVATATIRGTVNLTSNQPLALAFLSTSTTNQDVASASMTVSEVWLP